MFDRLMRHAVDWNIIPCYSDRRKLVVHLTIVFFLAAKFTDESAVVAEQLLSCDCGQGLLSV